MLLAARTVPLFLFDTAAAGLKPWVPLAPPGFLPAAIPIITRLETVRHGRRYEVRAEKTSDRQYPVTLANGRASTTGAPRRTRSRPRHEATIVSRARA